MPDGTPLVLDGAAGTVDVDPGEDAVAEQEVRREAEDAERRELLAAAAEPGVFGDGPASRSSRTSAARRGAAAPEQGAEGVGLLRTEFLFLDRETAPTEDEQVELLTAVAEALRAARSSSARSTRAPTSRCRSCARRRRTTRSSASAASASRSPSRRCSARSCARSCASPTRHPIAVMFPMVATLEEFRSARALLEEERIELGAPARPEVGVMVEVPALALAADAFAAEVDFFSVGTNDLSQYAMAAERGNAAVADLLEAARPSVLALIERVVEAADARGRWVGVCGELAGDPEAAVLLAGLGVRELSMAPSRIPAVKAALRAVDRTAAAAAAAAALPGGAR